MDKMDLPAMRMMLESDLDQKIPRRNKRKGQRVIDLSIEHYSVLDTEVSRWGIERGTKNYQEHLTQQYREKFGFLMAIGIGGLLLMALEGLICAVAERMANWWMDEEGWFKGREIMSAIHGELMAEQGTDG